MSETPVLLERYQQACSDNSLEVNRLQEAAALSALEDPFYGFAMEDSLETAIKFIEHDDGMVSVERIPTAIHILGNLLVASGRNYRRSHRKAVADQAGFAEDWEQHVEAVRAGKTVLLPDKYWSSKKFGEQQVSAADRTLNLAISEDQRTLAALNYQMFRPGKMPDVDETLSAGPEIAAEKKNVASMQHLISTNWAIAQIVEKVYKYLSVNGGRLHIIDGCPGTGSTLAAILNRLGQAVELGYEMDNDAGISILGYEATPAFFDQLGSDFLPKAASLLGRLGINQVELSGLKSFHNQPRMGEINLLQGDMVQGISNLDTSEIHSEVGEKDIFMTVFNYGLHRVSSRNKVEMFRKLAEQDDVVVVVGDFRRNASRLSRGHFNQTMNGSLNTGNMFLEFHLRSIGYTTITIGKDPTTLFSGTALRKHLENELDDDGFLTVAFKGPLAARAIYGT